ncbi:cupin domain-containing protein [Acetobacter sacchari]|uniref:Cupin domain-containing protein n=1 Tax=Acetobacter sacchari TaxID=2661687 RepID=A0ABS3LWH5_9PROT|nr:cupin domain-containing protein [Acetobacter sacchari]MBO1360243.1 cupin domain-containing protein [Acetobacter sacchari]
MKEAEHLTEISETAALPKLGSLVLNPRSLELKSWEKGSRYASADVSFGAILGLIKLGIGYSEVPPGKSGCPCHSHSMEEELFIILEGSGTYRFGDTEYPFQSGDILSAPAGGLETAHQIINSGETTLRYFALSANSDAEIVQYPDSKKIMSKTRLPGGQSLRRVTLQSDNLDYWEGEPCGG